MAIEQLCHVPTHVLYCCNIVLLVRVLDHIYQQQHFGGVLTDLLCVLASRLVHGVADGFTIVGVPVATPVGFCTSCIQHRS